MEYIFKGATIEQAEELGLEELGLTKEEVTIEVLKNQEHFQKLRLRLLLKIKKERKKQ